MQLKRMGLVVVGALLAVAASVWGAGAALPREHRAARDAQVAAAPERVAALVRDVGSHATWRSGLQAVELQSRTATATRYREIGDDGTIAYELTEPVPGQRFVTRIVDPSLPFGGRWTIDVIPEAGATRVRIEEQGYVDDPVYRFFSALVFGHTATMERYLADLSAAATHRAQP